MSKKPTYFFLLLISGLFFLSIVGVWNKDSFQVSPAYACCGSPGNPAYWLGNDCPTQTVPNGMGGAYPGGTCTPLPTPTPRSTPTPVSCQNTDCTQSVGGLPPCAPCTATAGVTPAGTPTTVTTPADTPTAVPTVVPTDTPQDTPTPTTQTNSCQSCDDLYTSMAAGAQQNFGTCGTTVIADCVVGCAETGEACLPECLAVGGADCLYEYGLDMAAAAGAKLICRCSTNCDPNGCY